VKRKLISGGWYENENIGGSNLMKRKLASTETHRKRSAAEENRQHRKWRRRRIYCHISLGLRNGE